MNDGARRAFARLDARQRHEGFVGRTNGVGAAHGAVEQRAVQRFVERLPAILVNAIDEEIGVKRGLADHGQHLAIARVHGNRHPTAMAVELLHHLLQLDVYGQLQTIARRGRAAAQLAHGMAASRGFHFLPASLAVQLLFVAFFSAQLADDFRAAIVGRVVRVINIFFFFLIDAPDIAHDMAGRLFERISSEQPRLDIYARKAIALGRKLGHFLVRQTRANGNGLKAFGVLHQPLELAPVTRCDLDNLAQSVNRLIKIRHLGSGDF